MEQVTRHVFDGYEVNSLGESKRPRFADSDPWWVIVNDGPDIAQPVDEDTTTVRRAVLYCEGPVPVESSSHDEWTVRGKRYLQDGEIADWRDPWGPFMGWSVKLLGRLG